MKHTCISAELRGGARRIQCRSAGSTWQWTAFRLPETSRSLETPQTVLQFFVLFCFGCKKMARYPRSLESPALFLSHPPSSCSSRSSSSRSSSRSTAAAAAAGAIYSRSSIHLPSGIITRGGDQGAGRGVSCAEICPVLSLGTWYTVSAGHIRNNTSIISSGQRTLYFRSAKSCERIRNVWLASLGAVIAAWNRVRLVNARRGPGLLGFEGSGLPISVATWPASAERGWLGMGRLVPP